MLSLEQLEARALLSITGSLQSAAAIAEPPGAEVSNAQVAGTTMTASAGAVVAQAQAAAITSVRSGAWSDPTIWSSGRVPTSADDVVILNNVTIDHAQVHQLDINAGTATLTGDLHAYASVVVRSSLVGTQGSIFFHVANDQLFTGNTAPGPDSTMPDFHPADTGLWVLRGGSINLQGAAVTPWLNAVGSGASQNLGNGVAQQTSFGATSATLQSAPVGWRAGDTLLLVNEHGQSVLASLVSVNGATIQYQQQKARPTDPDLIGHTLSTNGSNLCVSSVVANLTRRIQIVSADVREADVNHRAHTTYLNGASARLVNVEFRDLGTRGKQGDYPVYFNHGGASTSILSGSSIWQDVTDPGNRFVAIREMQGVTITNNVAYRSRGDGFFLEDRTATGNTISGNLSVQVTDGEEISVVDSSVTSVSHHYWLRAGNTISGNVAAGGSASGLIVLAGSANAQTLVNNFESLGTGLFGMRAGTPNVTFTNPVAAYNSRAGFASEPAWDVNVSGTVLNNPLLLFNGTSDSAYGSQIYLNDSPIVTINGGVLAGVKAFHTHYHSAFTALNTKIDVNTFMTPTYWEQAATLDGVGIHAALLFERAYPSPRYVSPGVVRFLNANVQIGNGPVELETADYIGDMFQNYPALQGERIPNAIELDQLAPASGFIRVTMLPDDQRWMTNIARWTVTPIGQSTSPMSFIYQRQTAWNKLASLGGYPDGFPPGQYAVSLYTDSGQLLQTGFVDVRSGQVSDLTLSPPTNNNPPVVTTSSGIVGAMAGAGAVVVDSGLVLSDDGTTLAGATVTIQSPGYTAGQDSLRFTNRPGITGSFNSSAGTLILSGTASLSEYQAALRSITYASSAPRAFNGERTIAFVVNDGTQSSNIATRRIVHHVLGDMDGNGVLNNFDVSDFELAAMNPNAFVARHPNLTDYVSRGDINNDGTLNNFDLGPFELLLTTGRTSTSAAAPSTLSAQNATTSTASASTATPAPVVAEPPPSSAAGSRLQEQVKAVSDQAIVQIAQAWNDGVMDENLFDPL